MDEDEAAYGDEDDGDMDDEDDTRAAMMLLCCCCPACCRRRPPGRPRPRTGTNSRRRRDRACLDCVECVSCGWRPLQALVAAAVGPTGRVLRGGVFTGERGTPWDDSSAFVVEDGLLVSGRWGGDAFLLGRRFLVLLELPVDERRSWV